MKISQRVMITCPDLFIAGRNDSVYGLFDPYTPLSNMPKDWIDCGVVEFIVPDELPFTAVDEAVSRIEKDEIDLIKKLKELSELKTKIIMGGKDE